MKKINLGDLSFEIVDKAYNICAKVEKASKAYDYRCFGLEDYDRLFKPLLNYRIKTVREFARDYREMVKDTLVFEAQEDFNKFIVNNLDKFVERLIDYTEETFE